MSEKLTTNEYGRKQLLREGMTFEQFKVYVKKNFKTLKNWKTCFVLAITLRVFLYVEFVVIWVFEMWQVAPLPKFFSLRYFISQPSDQVYTYQCTFFLFTSLYVVLITDLIGLLSEKLNKSIWNARYAVIN
ncbi:hypothetical protein CAEBREN_04983 [Caenorhabditis brenneri]|uniref:Uncharacterized protein n=1 Tax=Caenorhabditis brenneri TaxID=135651 RepID=G0MV34_CAEBE|nr:hypothetical protein CAEBREN_04983 [Caenorhabditis brenneri]